MMLIADIALIVWPLLVVGIFSLMPARIAVLVSFGLAWLFLPIHGFELPGIPDYSKMSATCIGIFASTLIFDFHSIQKFRFHWIDLILIVFCGSRLLSSITNGLGFMDGLSGTLSTFVAWGMPYLIGRIYFQKPSEFRLLSFALVIAGLVYVPFCLFEVRMSPMLHQTVYGFHQHSFLQSMRGGGFRPTVFMQHGLMVSSWMAFTTLAGFWAWNSKAFSRLRGWPFFFCLVVMLGTTVLCKSMGALLLFGLGLTVLASVQFSHSRVLVYLLILIAPIYVVIRTTGIYDGESAVALARSVSEERAGSLKFRIDNEDLLIEHALKQPLFGWGGWGRNRVYDDEGNDITVTDGKWIIELGTNGSLGLISFMAILLVPVTLVLVRIPVRQYASARYGPVVVLAVLVVLYTIDCLPNSMMNPWYVVIVGGLTSGLASPEFFKVTLVKRRAVESESAHKPWAVSGPRTCQRSLHRGHS